MYDVLGVLRLSLSTLGKVHEATLDFGKFFIFGIVFKAPAMKGCKRGQGP
jgi:hypothetical protein